MKHNGGTAVLCAPRSFVGAHRFELRRDISLQVLTARENCMPIDGEPDLPVDLASV